MSACGGINGVVVQSKVYGHSLYMNMYLHMHIKCNANMKAASAIPAAMRSQRVSIAIEYIFFISNASMDKECMTTT